MHVVYAGGMVTRTLRALGVVVAISACRPPPSAPVTEVRIVPPAPSESAHTADAPLAVEPAPAPGPTLALGREFACALESVPGRVFCWGANREKQLGDGTVVSRATAAPVLGVTDAVEVSAAGDKACVRTASGDVVCWGAGKPATQVPGLRDVARVVVESMRTCVVHRDGGVSCWGLSRWVPDTLNANAQTTGPQSSEPLRMSGLAAVTDLALGFNHACMRESSGALRCFGAATQGELGNASVLGREYVTEPVDVAGLRNARAIGAGHGYTCAVREDGRVACWGRNYRGSISGQGEGDHPTPTEIRGIEGAVSLVVSDDHACALLSNGTVRCFGNDDSGKLGTGGSGTVDGLRDATEVAVGPYASCARRRAGGVVCWGQNDSGQLGNGELPGVARPVRIDGITDAEDAALSDNTTCVLRTGGVVTCIGSPGGFSTPPARTDMTGFGKAVHVTAAEYYTCALSSAGRVACWGHVEKGPPMTTAAGEHGLTLPPAIATLPPVRLLSAGGGGTCAQLRSGDITCWANQGAPTHAPTSVTPAIPDAVEIEQGSLWGCAVQRSGHVVCWGLGYPSNAAKHVRSMAANVVPGISDAVHVSVGTNHACVVRKSGRVVCFGESSHMGLHPADGQQEIAGITDAVHVSAGMAHTCVATRTGDVWCWGWNDSGELGTSGPDSQVPQKVPSVTGAVKVAVGAHHSCAIGASHELTCWGRNVEGQVTTVTPHARPTPVAVIGLGNTPIAR